MTDTAQPLAAESDGIAEAANAFKVALGQADSPPERIRDEQGRFAAEQAEEAPEEAVEPVEEAEASDEVEAQDVDTEETAEEAQSIPMPTSWDKEQAGHWESLPPETQAFIAEREGERDKAVNQKFQEAANEKRGLQAQYLQAVETSQLEKAAAINQVIGLIGDVQYPSLTMLDATSGDYDPDGYHLLKAQADNLSRTLYTLEQQRGDVVAQFEQAQKQRQQLQVQQINEATKDAFFKDVPEASQNETAINTFQSLVEYAVSQGAPRDMFNEPTTALEWHMIWKAKKYDELQSAKAKVAATPPPPRKVQPPIRPGVTTPRSAVQKAQRDKAFDRLSKSGSIEDGAAVFKHLLR